MPGAPALVGLATPGHTDDPVSLSHEASATLVSGDAVLVHEGRGWCNPEITDAARSAETEGRLRGLPVEHLLPTGSA